MFAVSIVIGISLGLLSNWALGPRWSGWMWCAANALTFIFIGAWISLAAALACGFITALMYLKR